MVLSECLSMRHRAENIVCAQKLPLGRLRRKALLLHRWALSNTAPTCSPGSPLWLVLAWLPPSPSLCASPLEDDYPAVGYALLRAMPYQTQSCPWHSTGSQGLCRPLKPGDEDWGRDVGVLLPLWRAARRGQFPSPGPSSTCLLL